MTPTKHLAILIALAGTLALPSSALADSIVYIKRGDVWLARGDGSGQRALTRDGTPRNSYRAPSYSNGGVITALKGERNVYFLNRRGKRLRKPRDVIGGPVPPVRPHRPRHADLAQREAAGLDDAADLAGRSAPAGRADRL